MVKKRRKPGPPKMWPTVARLNIKLDAARVPVWREAAKAVGEGVSEYVREAVEKRIEEGR